MALLMLLLLLQNIIPVAVLTMPNTPGCFGWRTNGPTLPALLILLVLLRRLYGFELYPSSPLHSTSPLPLPHSLPPCPLRFRGPFFA